MSEKPPRSQARHFVGLIVITAAAAQSLGLTLKMPSQLEANDISRWCTVWSLIERGTYAIDDCPWQMKTQDKVLKPSPFETPAEGEKPAEHFYSSKPPLLPTLIAGALYPFRKLSGVPLDRVPTTPRSERYVQKDKFSFALETPKTPMNWPVHVYYFKPIIILLNVLPYLIFLILYARLLDEFAANDWAWFFGLVAAAWATPLLVFDQTLNNHSVAAFSAFFATFALIRILGAERPSAVWFAIAGFFGAFCACNELPAALFGLLLFAGLLKHDLRRTLLVFVPFALVPCAAFLATQYAAFGQFMPVYEEFGTKSYTYEGSYWNTPLEMDWLNKEPEPRWVYLWHMTFGHHGIFSLTPIVLFSLWGAARILRGKAEGSRPAAWLCLGLTAAMLAFYTWNPKARNYGGSTQGLRWLFWLIPFWAITLPAGVSAGQERRWVRALTLLALAVSVMSVGYALRVPWSHPWLLELMERMGLYSLKR